MTAQDLMRCAQMLTTVEQVDAFVRDNSVAILFKAGTCHRSDAALALVATALEGVRCPPIGLIRVVDARKASDHVAQLTGVHHESPQILIIKDGRTVFARDNWGITERALAQAFDVYFGPPAKTP